MNNVVEMISKEDTGGIDFDKFKVIFQPIEPRKIKDVKIYEIILESQENSNQTLCEDSSLF